jgi:hypothetical protein
MKTFKNLYSFCFKNSNKIIAFLTLSASQLNTGDARIFGINKVPIVLLGYEILLLRKSKYGV